MLLFRFIRLILICALLATLGLAGGVIYIDSLVKERLNERHTTLAPHVYSAPVPISERIALTSTQFHELLERRAYRHVSGRPTNPGEYSKEAGLYRILTKSFYDYRARLVEPQLIIFDLKHRTIENLTEPQRRSFRLEPEVIANLVSGDFRASVYTPIERIPSYVQRAVLAIEDQRFYSHFGIDLIGISRALVANLSAGRIVQGGSTITQQLAKNLFFTPERTLGRKALEALAALSIELRLPKSKIFELYLNEVFLGQDGYVAYHGFAQAAQTYFGKKLENVTVGEGALLAGVIKAPSYYSPRRHPERAKKRRNLVLAKMHELGFIRSAEFAAASKEPVLIKGARAVERLAPHYVTSISEELEQHFSLSTAVLRGVSVHTGIHPELQRCAKTAVGAGLTVLEENHKRLRAKSAEAALVSIDPNNGLVRAWVGGRNFSKSQFDRVRQAKRQVGSTIKPFLYLTALDPGLNQYRVANPTSILSDEPVAVELVTRDSWIPENYDKKFRGDVTLREAFEKSLNLPAVSVLQKVGVPALVRTARLFRLSEEIPAVPALALGAMDTTPLDLAAAYAALANGGELFSPKTYLSVTDGEDEIALFRAPDPVSVADPAAVYVLTNLMQGVLERGTGRAVRRLGFTHPAAGKTGSSSNTRDAWFGGFTPELATIVWVGFDDNSELGLTGGVAAAPIWTEYMKCAMQFVPPTRFSVPAGVTYVEIDPASGARATRRCPRDTTIREVFLRGTEPTRPCPIHSRYAEPQSHFEQEPQRSDLRTNTRSSARHTADKRERQRRTRSFWDIIFE